MTFDPMPAVQDPARLAVLRATELLDSPPDPAFDRATRLVARLLHAPVALVSLVDSDRQFIKSGTGLQEPLASTRQVTVEQSICKYVVASREPLIAADTRSHPWLKDCLGVTELGVAAYAGMPLIVQGQPLGSLCALDFQPRSWSEEEVSILRDLADSVTTEMELRLATVTLRAREQQLDDLVEHASDMIVSVSNDATILFANTTVREALGRGEMVGHSAMEYVAPEFHAAVFQAARRIEAEGFVRDFEAELVRGDGTRILTHGSGNCRYEKGLPVSKRLIFRDITAQRRAEQELALLERVTRGLAAAPDLESAFRVTLEEMARFSHWEYGDVWLPGSDGLLAQYTAWWSDPALEVFARESGRMRFAPGEGAIGGVARTREPVWLDLTLPNGHPRARLAADGGGRGAMVLPLHVGDEVLGVFTFGGRDSRGPEQHRVNALKAVIAQIGPVVQRRRAEALALDTQVRLQDFLDSINDLVMSVLPDGRISFVNRAWKRALGYTDEEVAQLHMDAILHPECRERCLQLFGRVLLGETVTGVEARFVARDGRVIDVEGSSNARFENGKAIATRSIFRDVTERRRAQDELERTAQMLDSANEAIVIHESGGRITYWNRGAERLYGWTREQALGCDMTELLRTRFGVPKEQLLGRLQAEGRWVGELVHTSKDGRQVVVESGWTLLPEAGRRPAVLEINSDVTERKRAQELFGAVLRAATESSIVAFHDTGLITAFNAGAERMLGYSADEVVGKASPLLFHEPSEMEAVSNQLGIPPGIDLFVARARAGEAETREWTYVRKDGSRVPVAETVTAMRDDHGNVTGFIAIASDVRERKRVEQALRLAKQAAEDAARAKSEFLANMSHEIRTPMNGVLGMTELLLDTELTREQREYLEMVHGSAESLLGIINDILDFSRMEAGKLSLDPHPFHLRDGFGDTLRTLAVRAREKGIELAYRVAPDVPDALIGDLGRLRQVLVNLASNAIKFTERGEVVVEVSAETADSGSVLLHVSVRDSGIGIPLERQAAIFEAFTQADASTTRRFGGTGLGLSISAQIVNLMHGRIWVESLPGKGSTFRLVVPLKRDELPAAAQASHLPAELSALRVLVVDDNPTNRLILQELLGSWGIYCVAAAEGPPALSELRLHADTAPFDVVLLDAVMPRMDGFAVAAAMRADPSLHGTVIMMLSSAADPRDAARCREAGIEHYLAKPVKQSDLFELLLAATAGRGRPAEGAQAERPPAARALRLLVAEDNPVNQRLARAILEKAGHAVTLAANGREAVDIVAAEPFDAVLMDVQMPELNGLQATQLIRASEGVGGAHIPIIAVTAHAMKGDLERCLEAGMDGYISKPLKAAELLDLLQAMVPGPGVALAAAGTVAEQPALAPAPEAARMLEAVGGDADLLAELAGLFLTDAQPLVSELREALAAGDAERVYHAAHRLKGSAGVFAAEELLQTALRLEQLGRAGELAEAPAALEAVAAACDRLAAVLAPLVATPAQG